MMVAMLVIVVLLSVSALTYLVGFRLGQQSSFSELHQVQVDAAIAERYLHDLTRSAFVAMAEEAERRRFGNK